MKLITCKCGCNILPSYIYNSYKRNSGEPIYYILLDGILDPIPNSTMIIIESTD